MAELSILFVASLIIGFMATLFWSRSQQLSGRLFGAFLLGPSFSILAMTLFKLGMWISGAARTLGLWDVGEPSGEFGLLAWLRYGCISSLLPFFVLVFLLAIIAVVGSIGPDMLSLPFFGGDGFDAFLTGSSMTDAFGCVTLATTLLGPIPYGMLYAVLGWLFGLFNAGYKPGVAQDVLSVVIMGLVIWVSAGVSALRRK